MGSRNPGGLFFSQPTMTPTTPPTRSTTRRGFSLIELVIVVVIIGVIGAIAVPRLSRGARGAELSRTINDLAVMNKALDLYAAEHGGAYPTDAKFVPALLTTYSDAAGNDSPTATATHIYGPYIRAIPAAVAGKHPGSDVIGDDPDATCGWLYDASSGQVYLNRGAKQVGLQIQVPLTADDLRVLP